VMIDLIKLEESDCAREWDALPRRGSTKLGWEAVEAAQVEEDEVG
jgi:hypothetical protein